jgi:hypothetical protein
LFAKVILQDLGFNHVSWIIWLEVCLNIIFMTFLRLFIIKRILYICMMLKGFFFCDFMVAFSGGLG